jgi:hypothetical protein
MAVLTVVFSPYMVPPTVTFLPRGSTAFQGVAVEPKQTYGEWTHTTERHGQCRQSTAAPPSPLVAGLVAVSETESIGRE